MSTQKHGLNEGSATPAGPETGAEEKDASQAGLGSGVEILSLKIADEIDTGGDPYNRTGSFCDIKNPDDD